MLALNNFSTSNKKSEKQHSKMQTLKPGALMRVLSLTKGLSS